MANKLKKIRAKLYGEEEPVGIPSEEKVVQQIQNDLTKDAIIKALGFTPLTQAQVNSAAASYASSYASSYMNSHISSYHSNCNCCSSG